MKKTILPFIFLIFSLGIKASILDSMFVNAPFQIFPYLTPTQRIELLDCANTSKKPAVQNALGDTTYLDVYSPTYFRIKLSDVSTLEMKLIGENEKHPLLLLCETCCGTACDSYLAVYDENWKEKKKKRLTERPKFSEFLKEGYNEPKGNIGFMPLFIRAELSENENSIIFTLDAESALGREQWREWKDKLKTSVVRPITK